MRAAKVQASLRIRCSLIQVVSQEEPSDRKPDPWTLWMTWHAQLKFVMTECSKTQIRLTGLIYAQHTPKQWYTYHWKLHRKTLPFFCRDVSDTCEMKIFFNVSFLIEIVKQKTKWSSSTAKMYRMMKMNCKLCFSSICKFCCVSIQSIFKKLKVKNH